MSLFSYGGQYYHQTTDKRLFKLSELATPHLFNILNSVETPGERQVYEEELSRRTSTTLRTPIHDREKFALLIKFTSDPAEVVPIKDTIILDALTALGNSFEKAGIPFTEYSGSLNRRKI